jgi:transposase InsO family protein
MAAAETLGNEVGVARACHTLGVPRATLYRRRARATAPAVEAPARPAPPLKLTAAERDNALAILHSERFVDASPHTIHATLLDEGQYPCSVRTLYRILDAEEELRERRNLRQHPQYAKPELLATGPNQLWSWDITKLKGPAKWTYFYLYVIIDVFSRQVVGWMVATRESATLAKQFISEACAKHHILPGQLTLHADRGSSMKSKPVALLLTDLGVTKSHSRPYTSDDNPFSESNFKTLKYRPDFPASFGCLQDARAHCQRFFHWYNNDHRHSGIAFMTPADVHYGRAEDIIATRSQTLDAAFAANPARFKGKPPAPKLLPEAVWINPPTEATADPKEPPEQH